jgi:seryl-tRNA synthetase
MHSLDTIRANPSAFDAGLKSRGIEPQADSLIALDDHRRAAIATAQSSREQRNTLAQQIGQIKRNAVNSDTHFDTILHDVRAQTDSLKRTIEESEALERTSMEALENVLSALPNIPLPDVPIGEDETGNREERRNGTPRLFEGVPQEHFTLGENLNGLHFEAASRMSGSRFVVLTGLLARLERALGEFMLDLHTQHHGYLEVSPPLLVRSPSLFGTGQLPKFEADQFATSDDLWLVPTAEVCLTNLVRESILNAEDLPLRFTALTPCFRREAGSAGRDMRGMLRQHQFKKVELVSITTSEQDSEELERMVTCAEAVLKALELPYRVMTLCTGDMGFSSMKTYDLEVWLPGQGTYREISSCSLCGDFQARRMNTRYRDAARNHKKLPFVTTLNGSGVAIGRALIAVLENGQNPDGSITLPKALQPYIGGIERLDKEQIPF